VRLFSCKAAGDEVDQRVTNSEEYERLKALWATAEIKGSDRYTEESHRIGKPSLLPTLQVSMPHPMKRFHVAALLHRVGSD
jgi:hypothetical protein